MKRLILMGCALGLVSLAAQAQDGLPPPEAEEGACYMRLVTPAEMETVVERVLIREASTEIVIIPAVMETVTEERLVREASTEFVVVPAQYQTVMETIEIEPGVTKTYTKQVVSSPAEVIEREIPAQYETVTYQRVVQPARQQRRDIPAVYETVERKVVTAAETTSWEKVVCKADITADHMKTFQLALTQAGYPVKADGKFGPQTLAAMEAFQKANGYSEGYMTIETVEALGLSFD